MSTRAGIAIVTILLLAIAGAAVLSGNAHAAGDTYSATMGDDRLVLLPQPCTKAGDWFKTWRAARWLYKGEWYEACWRVQVDDQRRYLVMVVDAQGIVSGFNPARFTKDEGT